MILNQVHSDTILVSNTHPILHPRGRDMGCLWVRSFFYVLHLAWNWFMEYSILPDRVLPRRPMVDVTVISNMMMSSNGNIFRVIGPLWGEFTVTGEFLSQILMTWSFDIFFGLRLSKQSRRRWFETPSRPLCRHCNECSCPTNSLCRIGV